MRAPEGDSCPSAEDSEGSDGATRIVPPKTSSMPRVESGVQVAVRAPESVYDESDKPRVAGYELVKIIGRGGMGVVWEAIEMRLERRVALKIQTVESDSTKLFTEAQLSARIGDPSIVNIYDVGLTFDERPYFAMELVQGHDLAKVLAEGAMLERKALFIAAELARAVAAAHKQGVIHRDLKPSNIIIDSAGHARILDFGIALDTRKALDPRAGHAVGSPKYMAPEQVRGEVSTPATDIWGIGVILYAMVTGRTPFGRAPLAKIRESILEKNPPAPSDVRAGLHHEIDGIVMRCLFKNPLDRWQSAAALRERILALLEGRPVASVAPKKYQPKTRIDLHDSWPRREDAGKHVVWRFELASPPEALWPYVSDTDRFNKAVGLASATFTDQLDEHGRPKKTGAQRALGLKLDWNEHPFEWVENREHAVFREYTAGPLACLWNRVTLEPRPGGGCILQHEISLTPRNTIGRVAAIVEIEHRLAGATERFYRRLDKILTTGEGSDPFEPLHRPSGAEHAAVQTVSLPLRSYGFDENIVSALEKHLLTTPDGALAPLRPRALAKRWGTDPAETIDALLHAAHLGALQPSWDAICPKCRVVQASYLSLADVSERGNCPACNESYDHDLADALELVFVPTPAVRSVPRETYCVGSPARRPHVIVQKRIIAGDQTLFTIDLGPGSYRIVAERSKRTFDLVASPGGFVAEAHVVFDGSTFVDASAIVRSGTVMFSVENASGLEEWFRVERVGPRSDSFPASNALVHPTFKRLFGEDLPALGRCLPVHELAFVAIRFDAASAMLQRDGDDATCRELARANDLVAMEAQRFEGDLAPTSLTRVLAVFPTAALAMRAALSLVETLPSVTRLEPTLAVHAGPCIGLTRNGRIELFGETVEHVRALCESSPSGAVALSETLSANRELAILAYESNLALSEDVARSATS